MAEQRDDKPKLPLAGLFALLGMISGFLFYQGISLKTSRPIDREIATNVSLKKGIVQSRLWQDPFEALDAHKALERKLSGKPEEKNGQQTLDKLVRVIEQSGVSSLRILPVFVDGSPYVSGAESRLNDRYAVVSALGAAGYAPESGEYIRFFQWRQNQAGTQGNNPENCVTTRLQPATGAGGDEIDTLIPTELYFPTAKLRDQPYGTPLLKPVLVLWLKEQDAIPGPLMFLNDLLAYFKKSVGKGSADISLAYDVLGPHSSTALRAMLKELQQVHSVPVCPPFDILTQARIFSPWATAEDTFLLDHSPDKPAPLMAQETDKKRKESEHRTINELLTQSQIMLTRTINSDAVLAEQLLHELKRRQVDLKPCADRRCNPRVALISEWDTPYGRALPRTFAAVAMNKGSGETGPSLKAEIDKLRRDEWPSWIYRHSYLAGLDGELPASAGDKSADKDKDSSPNKASALLGGQPHSAEQNAAQRPEGRGQLDYVVRLAAALKQEETRNGEEFKAIGVLGSDVYDKLLILQALRPSFPRAVFFTTDLNARLSYSSEWPWTRNLIIASHFGLELQPELQKPIPPFRDSYQTSLFYSALWALDHFISTDSPDCPGCFRVRQATNEQEPGGPAKPAGTPSMGTKFSADAKPRLYEVGRHGAFDISTDAHPRDWDFASIHPPRRDLQAYADTERNLKWVIGAIATTSIVILGTMLISSTVAAAVFKLASNMWFWTFLALTISAVYGAVMWTRHSTPDLLEDEPFTLTEGISAWPTAIIELLALLVTVIFLLYSRRKLKDSEKMLALRFGLEKPAAEGKDHRFSEDKSSEDKSGVPHPLAYLLPFRSLGRTMKYLTGLNVWRAPLAGQVDAVQLWNEYTTLGNLKNFVMRCAPQVGVALCFSWLMMALFGFPNIPCRGSACFAINEVILTCSIVAMVLLICYVVDVTLLCRRWVNSIAMNKIRWPGATLERISHEQGLAKKNLDDWLGIELIAERTRVIGNFIYFPFIAMFLIGIARYPYLDNWDFPAALILIFVLSALFLVGNTLALRRSAETARRQAIKRLGNELTRLSNRDPDEVKQRQQIEWAIDAIKQNQRGAFLPFTQHPIFGAAIALPSGGYGLVLLLEYLATGF